MSLVGLKFLILVQIGMDIAIILVFIFLIKKFRDLNNGKSFDNEVQIFESLITDANKVAQQFKEQLKEKHHLIQSLDGQLEKRIVSLNVLLNRADVLLSSQGNEVPGGNDTNDSLSSQKTKILALAKKGHRVEEIASILSVPKGGVKLVLDLKEKFSMTGSKEGVS